MNRETTVSNLQTALAMELTASHQYQLHASVLSDRLARTPARPPQKNG